MRKKWLALALAVTMVLGLTACGSDGDSASTNSKSGEEKKEVEMVPEDTGKVLNIWVWNTEFKDRFEKYYPDYNADTQSIGDVKVKFTTNANENNVYQTKLDEALQKQDAAPADEKIDIFLMEMDYVAKYTKTDYALDVKTLGIKDEDLTQMYDYTKQAATDDAGVLKALTWQGCPGAFIYRRSYAKKIFKTDDPAKIQEELSDWDKFDAAAQKVKDESDGKMTMVSGFDDMYRVFGCAMTAPWVDGNGKISFDSAVEEWITKTKEYTDNGFNQKSRLWAKEWTAGIKKDGNVFGYFMPAWGIYFSLKDASLDTPVDDGGKEEKGNGSYGDWAACLGPQSFNWGGSFIAACKGTDNGRLIGDIMKQLCANKEIQKNISKTEQDFVNNKEANTELVADGVTSPFLGDQAVIDVLAQSAEKITAKNVTAYDQGCVENVQTAMADYYNGKVDLDKAKENFFQKVITLYPNLKK